MIVHMSQQMYDCAFICVRGMGEGNTQCGVPSTCLCNNYYNAIVAMLILHIEAIFVPSGILHAYCLCIARNSIIHSPQVMSPITVELILLVKFC